LAASLVGGGLDLDFEDAVERDVALESGLIRVQEPPSRTEAARRRGGGLLWRECVTDGVTTAEASPLEVPVEEPIRDGFGERPRRKGGGDV